MTWPVCRAPLAPFTALAALVTGCMTVGVRSAEVQPGLSTTLQASATSSLGDEAGWFFAFDCESNCDTHTMGADASVTYGVPDGIGGRPVSFGLGTSTIFPYAEGYVQLANGRVPFGVGARVGLPVWSWRQHQLVARLDVPLGAHDAPRLLIDPGLFVHEGRAPNGDNPGRVVAFTQGLGVLVPGTRGDFMSAVTLVAGRARHDSYGASGGGPGSTTFAAVSVGVTLHRRRP